MKIKGYLKEKYYNPEKLEIGMIFKNKFYNTVYILTELPEDEVDYLIENGFPLYFEIIKQQENFLREEILIEKEHLNLSIQEINKILENKNIVTITVE